jgi:trimeric autotransporter adhesin
MKPNTLSLVVFALLTCFAVSPMAQAVVPPPDGGYPGGNTAEGQSALFSLTTGTFNTAVGFFSLRSNTEGESNTAVGAGTLLANTADGNTAIGMAALLNNTTGTENTANGGFGLFNNNAGNFNTATGYQALFNNTAGTYNTADGRGALVLNTTGGNNTAIGAFALGFNTAGDNTAVGSFALQGNTTGGRNTTIGDNTLASNTTGSENTALGSQAGGNITGSRNVCIGAGVSGEAGTDGRTYIRNVNTFPQNFSAGVNEYVTVRLSDGRLGHTFVTSSKRYKEDIKPLSAVSEALYALKPVSFRMKKECDETQPLGFGLIAEEVEKVNPALVYWNDKGQVESVRYDMVNAMLLNEFLKEHKKVETLESAVASLAAMVREQTGQIREMSTRLEMNKATGNVALVNE